MVTQRTSVQKYPSRNGFAKKVGSHRGRDGSAKPKVWYFLHVDQREACRRAEWLKTEWRRLRALGHEVWPATFAPPWANLALPVPSEPTPWLVSNSTSPASAPTRETTGGPPNRTVRLGELLLGDALELFKAAKAKEAQAGLISAGRVQNIRNFLGRAVSHVGPTTPLVMIDRAKLEEMVLHFRSRPPRLLPDGKKGEPISAEYAKSIVDNAATMFRWCAKNLRWQSPADFEAIFECAEFKPLNEKERKAAHLARKGEALGVFPIAVLNKLYHAANAHMRAWLLLGLNCAFTQVDLSDLREYEVESGTEWRIERAREKTNVEGSWVLWPETVAAMQAVRAAKNEQERWFLSPTGKLLVQRDKRSDYVARQFAALVDGLGLSCPSFKGLRKTSATAMLTLSGSRAFQDAQTAHSEGYKMAQHYADRQWDPLHEYQRKMREYFKGVWAHSGNNQSSPAR